MQLSFIFIGALMLKRQLEEEFENIVRTPATISVTEPRSGHAPPPVPCKYLPPFVETEI